MSLQQVYLSESLNLRWMARWAELFSLYQSIVASGRQPLIIDCGANIGLSARYLSETFPGARVIGVEPSSANIARARENCTYPNVEFIEAAISSEVGRASLDDVGLGHNAYRVSQDAGGPIAVISMQSLIEDCEARGYVPFIAKIDIEGHEAALFSNNTAWIDAFSLLIVELHDWMLPGKRNSAAFIRAMADRNRDFLLHGEHVISIANPVEAS
jgi:FkbM family methyltransferase